jgi:hypothetical protein
MASGEHPWAAVQLFHRQLQAQAAGAPALEVLS